MAVVVSEILGQHLLKMAAAEDEDPVEALPAYPQTFRRSRSREETSPE